MKKIFIAIAAFASIISSLHAFYIGGEYATLIECEWGQYGYEYGHIGTYEMNGEFFVLFFGDNYCEY